MKIGDTLVKNTIIIFMGKVFTQFTSFLLLPLYTAYLTTSEYGTSDLIFTYIGLLSPVIILQFDAGVFRFVIDCDSNKQKIEETISTFFTWILLMLIVFNVIYSIFIHFFHFTFSIEILICLNFSVLLNFYLQLYRGLGKSKLYSFCSFANGLLVIALNIAFVVIFKMSVRGMILSSAIGAFFVVCISTLYIKRNYNIRLYLNDKVYIKKVMKYTVPLIFNGISWWIMSLSDRTIINMFMAVSSNGIYAISNKFSTIYYSAYNILNLSWTESLSRNINYDYENLRRIHYFINRLLLSITIIFISVIYIIFPMFINPNFKEATLYIPILLVASYLNALASQYGSVLVAYKSSKIIAKTSFYGAFLNLLINIICIKYIGLYAASISTLVGYLIMLVYRYVSVNRIRKFNLGFQNTKGLFIVLLISFLVYYRFDYGYSTLNLIFVTIILLFYNKDIFTMVYQKIRR